MNILVWMLSLAAIFWLGYYLRDISDTLKQLQESVKNKVSKPSKIEEPVSTIIDPTDPIAEAKYQQELLMKKMNPYE